MNGHPIPPVPSGPCSCRGVVALILPPPQPQVHLRAWRRQRKAWCFVTHLRAHQGRRKIHHLLQGGKEERKREFLFGDGQEGNWVRDKGERWKETRTRGRPILGLASLDGIWAPVLAEISAPLTWEETALPCCGKTLAQTPWRTGSFVVL